MKKTYLLILTLLIAVYLIWFGITILPIDMCIGYCRPKQIIDRLETIYYCDIIGPGTSTRSCSTYEVQGE